MVSISCACDAVRFGVRLGSVELGVEAHDFLERLVRVRGVFELHVEDRVDPVLAHQRPEAVLPARAGEDRAVAKRVLRVDVELGGPPRGHSVLELHPGRDEIAAALLRSVDRVGLNLQVARLLQVVRVRDEVGSFLRGRSRGKPQRGNGDAEQKGKKSSNARRASRSADTPARHRCRPGSKITPPFS